MNFYLPKDNEQMYIFDYFLDGHFLKTEEVCTEHCPQPGETRVISTSCNSEIVAHVTGVEEISEDEYRILLASV